MCNTEKHLDNFYKKFSESKDSNRVGGLERYYETEVRISNQQKIYYEKIEKKCCCKSKTIDVYNLET